MSQATSSDVHAELKASLAANPGQILEQLAAQHGVSLSQAVECLPAELWRRTRGSRLVEVMQQIAAWQTTVTVIVHSADAILEFTAPLPEGNVGHGFYNLQGSSGLHGHIRAQNCATIYLLERPFMGKPTVSLLFCNTEGAAMFKIFAGRDVAGQLLEDQVGAMRTMMEGFAHGDSA